MRLFNPIHSFYRRGMRRQKSDLLCSKSHSHVVEELRPKFRSLGSQFYDLSHGDRLKVLKSTKLSRKTTSKSQSLLNTKHIPCSA